MQPAAGWSSPLYRDHPLVGRIWDVRGRRWADEATLVASVSRADFVLLGETHDNADHHVFQARLIRAVADAGRRPAVAFEMLDAQQQPTVDAALAASPRDPDALARAVGWARSGWPDFALYRPVFAAALDAGLPVLAVNLPRREAHEVVARGVTALAPPVRRILERAGPLSETAAQALREEMSESHCGALPESMLDGMVLMQRARDAEMAERLLSGAGSGGGVLVAGAGHVRTDRAVPAHLAREAPGRSIVAVCFLEVSSRRSDPESYRDAFGADALPCDFAVFTPQAERSDPCEGLRERRHSEKAPEPPAQSL
jgi:uncharacterized iron-regulated protein